MHLFSLYLSLDLKEIHYYSKPLKREERIMSVFVIIFDSLWYIQHSNHSAQYYYIDW